MRDQTLNLLNPIPMKDDKKTNKSDTPEPVEAQEEEIIYEEELHWSEVIQCVFAAFSSIEDVDMELASPMDKKRIRRRTQTCVCRTYARPTTFIFIAR